MDDPQLIELVRQRPCLYNALNADYKDFNIRDSTWAEISKIMDQPVEECKGRWKNIRDTLMRRIRNKNTRRRTFRSQKTRKWHLEPSLAFLNVIKTERTTSKTTKRDTDNSDEESYSHPEDVKLEEITDNESSEESQFGSETVAEQQSKRKQCNKEQQKEKPCSAKKQKLMNTTLEAPKKDPEESPKTQLTFGKKSEEHPIDVFFKSMAASVKNMTVERQIRAKMQVCQIIGQLELEEITPSTSK